MKSLRLLALLGVTVLIFVPELALAARINEVTGIDSAGPRHSFFHFQRPVAAQCVTWLDAAWRLLWADGSVPRGAKALFARRCSLACRPAGRGSGISLEHVERSCRH